METVPSKEKLIQILQEKFGFKEFRNGQLEAINFQTKYKIFVKIPPVPFWSFPLERGPSEIK